MAVTARTAAVKSKTSERIRKRKVNLRQLALFCRQLGTMYEAGIPIVDALRTVASQVPNRYFGVVIRIVADDLSRGMTLTWSLERHPQVFPPILTNVVAAGEASGNLDDALDRTAAHFEREHEMREKVRSALSYPAVILSLAVLVCIFLMVVVIPNFAVMFETLGGDLPGPTRALIWISNFSRDYFLYIAVGAALFGLLLARYLRTPEGMYRLDTVVLKVPIMSRLIMLDNVSRFCRTLAALTNTGIPLVVGLGLVEKAVGNRVLGKAVADTKEAVRRGQGISGPLKESGAFPDMVSQMIAVGEETGQVSHMLDRLAGYYERDLVFMTDSLSKMIEPIMIVLLAIGVGFIVISVAMPMFDMWTLIK